MHNHRKFQAGMQRLEELNAHDVPGMKERLNRLHPELRHFIIEHAYGEIQTRPGLDKRSRQLATVSCLITQGGVENELRTHLRNAMSVGISEDELVEVILHLTVYCGYPRAVAAMDMPKRSCGRESTDLMDSESRASIFA